jgi:CRP/FNR family transcriptional regulator, cyclic AMP receptor protein
MDAYQAPVVGSLLAYLEPEEHPFLLGPGVRRSFVRDELMLRQGDPSDHVFVLTSGWVRVTVSSQDGQEVLLALRGPGDVVGELAAVQQWPRTANVRALEPVHAVQLSGTQFMTALCTRPAVAVAVIRQLAERLREAEAARVANATLDVSQRVAAYLLQLADRHGVAGRDGIVIRMPLTQQDLANRIGASRRAVARAMAVLRGRHIVVTARRRIVVARPDVLSSFAHAVALS